ncbi:hypothetical protein PPTG_23389 [Phytophthora nicotianae INRA-310]|uniref:Uncharacterized protein n=1 Tax=Phytophthora nicotianae (strain INRA-310) TaxID=761204 RepID=W2Q095_PHYN3|nr:hypothetical protein PPTG_23389 [Phytophthora nicotianae INRA-310]ETN05939.1 hypothetical protein PPTG_23389 [Phytophthora nicotianae INRA-310]
MEWDGLEVPMRLRVNLASERYVYESPASVQAAKKRMVQILDAKYAKVNLDSCIPDHLDSNQQHALRKLLELFDDLNEAGLGKNYSVPILWTVQSIADDPITVVGWLRASQRLAI